MENIEDVAKQVFAEYPSMEFGGVSRKQNNLIVEISGSLKGVAGESARMPALRIDEGDYLRNPSLDVRDAIREHIEAFLPTH